MSGPSNFSFLWPEWQDLHAPAVKAEALIYPDARASCFYARRALELAVAWLYKHDRTLKLPYSDNLSALIYDPTFKALVGDALVAKATLIKNLGNAAAHSTKKLTQLDALRATTDLFHFLFWVARTYSRTAKPPDSLNFDGNLLPKTTVPPKTIVQIQQLEAELKSKDEKLTALLTGKNELDAELQRLREEIAAAKQANTAVVDTHDYSEAETRDYFVDRLLDEAGWKLEKEGHDTEFPVIGMPTNSGDGFVDYVLWGDDGKPLGLIEAKRTRKDAKAGQQQAKLYADALEKQFGQRPVIFCSNGYEHWIWDDLSYAPRQVQGFYKKNELELLIQRRTTRKPLGAADISTKIVDRPYQHRAIRRIGESFEGDRQRKALLVMATGAGKTRTVIALSDLLMRCNWAKRILFLADRNALVNQAVNAFKTHLPDASPVNLVKEKDAEGRTFLSTYPTMMGLIDDSRGGERRFGVGHFDLIVIDEAHRSVYKKYGAIFDYFDSLLVGLTATPKADVGHNTYRFFDLEDQVPTDEYSLDEAIADGVLVPPKAVSIDIRFPREGITYDELSDDEKDEWDALEWSEDGDVPDRVEAPAVNSWLFNADTVDKVLQHLWKKGQRVAGGDLLGKTIIFAKNHKHAEFIAERFNINFPQYKGHFARVLDFEVNYVQSLIDDFSNPSKMPHIAISVDMLDTGIDIPEVVNLVFFKIVRSKTKFWQMIGRGTRLAPNLFGPGEDKRFFYIFDYMGNLQFFKENPETTEGTGGAALSTRIFRTRVDVVAALDRKFEAAGVDPAAEGKVREAAEPYTDYVDDLATRVSIAETLHKTVSAMNVDNFVVRPKRRLVEKYSKPESWKTLPDADRGEILRELAPLPAELPTEDEEAKRFDLLMLRIELARLQGDGVLAALVEKVQAIASLLEEKATIPVVREHLILIQEIQTVEWWQDVTVSMIESARRKLRGLVKLIEKKDRKVVYTDFEDEITAEHEIDFSPVLPRSSANFQAKARQFLRAHTDHISVQKVRMNRQLTPSDISELERMLIENAVGTAEDLAAAREQSEGKLGLFIRSLVGLDRVAAKDAFASFLSGKTLNSNQLEFIDLMINHLTERGFMDPASLYESPYTDLHVRGVEGLFKTDDVDQLIGALASVRDSAAA
jgi:type I restriction enzyme R subunit